LNETQNEKPSSPIFCPSCAASVADSAVPGTILRCPVCGTEFKYEPEKTGESSIAEGDNLKSGSTERRLSTDEILLDRLKNEPPEKPLLPIRSIAILFIAVIAIAFGVYHFTSRPDKYLAGQEIDSTAILKKRLFFQHIVDSLQMQIVQHPSNIGYHLELADALYDGGEWAESKKEFETYLAVKPSDADARVDYSYAIAQDNGDLNAAIAEIDTALTYHPDHLNALINAGIMSAQLVTDTNHATALARSKDYFERARAVAEKSHPDIARRIDTLIMEIDSTGLRMRQR
jgi:tetratricopeptide (TPR) repeat protein